MYNHNKAQQSKNRVHISWDILYSARDLRQIIPVYVMKKLRLIAINKIIIFYYILENV